MPNTSSVSYTHLRPKIANYPFTTLEPNLGIVSYREGKSFVMADIHGIIEGASEGKGLGLRFLRHIERNSLLLFLVPGDTDDIRKAYEILLNELATFNPEMLAKQRVLAITKSDMLDEELIAMLLSLIHIYGDGDSSFRHYAGFGCYGSYRYFLWNY